MDKWMNNLKEEFHPQNLDAEQSVLGAILLDPDSIVPVMEFLVPERFLSSKPPSDFLKRWWN